MLSTKSAGYSALFMLALGATLQPSVNAISFDGMYTRSSTSPNACIQTNSCKYQCVDSYTISTGASTAYIYLDGYAPGCECTEFMTNISGNTTSGWGYNGTAYSATRTANGLTVVTHDLNITCTSTYYYTAYATSGAAQVGGYVRALSWTIATAGAVMMSFF